KWRVLLAPSRRCAQSAASSPVLRDSISRSNSSLKLADSAAESSLWQPRLAAPADGLLLLPLPSAVLSRFGVLERELAGVGTTRSGASRSSSPAMPTSVKRE